MRHGAKRLLSLLIAVVIVFSQAAVPTYAEDDGDIIQDGITLDETTGKTPAAGEDGPPSGSDEGQPVRTDGEQEAPQTAASSEVPASVPSGETAPDEETISAVNIDGETAPVNDGDSLPIVTLTENKDQDKYIFANSEYHSRDRITELSGVIKGRLEGGSEVELIPEWHGPEKLFNAPWGSGSTYFGANTFTADTFTVRGTGEKVQTDSNTYYSSASLNVWVIAVNANPSCQHYKDNNGKISVMKSQVLALQNEAELQALLGLPTEASVSFQPQRVVTGTQESLTEKAQNQNPFHEDEKTYKITGWEPISYNEPLSVQFLKNFAGNVYDKPDSFYLWADLGGLPKWAYLQSNEMMYQVEITPDPTADVTVTPPKDITYGETLGEPSATAYKDGVPVPNAKFIYTYEGINGTNYLPQSAPPTDAGKYRVTAILDAPGYSGSASATFTIGKIPSVRDNAYITVSPGDERIVYLWALYVPILQGKDSQIRASDWSDIDGNDGNVIESCTKGPQYDGGFTLKIKNDAKPGDFQTFSLPLTSANYDQVDVKVTVRVAQVKVEGVKLQNPNGIFYSGTPMSEIVDLTNCKVTVNGQPTQGGTIQLLNSGVKLSSGGYNDYHVPALVIIGDVEYRVDLIPPYFYIDTKKAFTTTSAFITLPNGEERTIALDQRFITGDLSQGAKILEKPSIDTDGKPIESYTAEIDAANFTLKSAEDAPNGSSQTFLLVLTSEKYARVEVTVTVQNDTVEVTGAKLMGDSDSFPDSTALSEIVDLTACTAKINNAVVSGTFALKNPDETLAGPNEYTDYSVLVLFTTRAGKTYEVSVSVPDFTVKGSDQPDGADDSLDARYTTIYANSPHNQSADALLNLMQTRNGSYTIGGQPCAATWKAASGIAEFEPKGYKENVWYAYTATLEGSSGKPTGYIRVIPVNASPWMLAGGDSSGAIKAKDVAALTEDTWMSALNLPSTLVFKNEPAQIADFVEDQDKFPIQDAQSGCPITGWKMDGGQELTLAALKELADSLTDEDLVLRLTPVYTPKSWATVKGEIPTFQLTITPKILVDVVWDGPVSPITYGAPFDPGAEPIQADAGGGIDNTNTFTWNYIYYKADGVTRLERQPRDAGTYQVRAVLRSATHSGSSALKEFTINPKPIDGLEFALPDNLKLVYNKRPQTPEYIVKDGGAALKKDTDYMAAYRDNVNAGTATVTFTGMGNYTGTKEATFRIEKCPLTGNQKPVIRGVAAGGYALWASLESVDSGELTWLWQIDGTAAATGGDYEVRPEDSNRMITVIAKAKENGNYSGQSGISDGKRVEKLRVTGSVTITAANTGGGRIAAGTVLTAQANVSPAAAKDGGSWSWRVDGIVKPGAGSSYTVAEGDKEIVAVFTPNGNYTGGIESLGIETGKVLLTGTVSVETVDAGPAMVGSRLRAVAAVSPATGTLTYTWLRDGEPISAAAGETYTITSGDQGKRISVRVTGEDCTGALISNSVSVPAAVPGPPAGVTAAAGDSLLNISWSAPADNGGAPIIRYSLKVMEGSTTIWQAILEPDVFSYRLEGLSNGTAYSVSVRAINKVGGGEIAETVGTPKASSGDGGEGGGESGGGAGTVSVMVKKAWKLDDGGKATDFVTVILLRNGEEYKRVTLSGENHWTYTWKELSGNYVWAVIEENVPDGFTSRVRRSGRCFIITNDDKPVPKKPAEPTPDKPSLPETIVDAISQREAEIRMTLSIAILVFSTVGMIVTLRRKRFIYKGKYRKGRS